MAEVTNALTFEDAVREIMSRVNCSESRARFIAAIERGEIESDEHVVSETESQSAA